MVRDAASACPAAVSASLIVLLVIMRLAAACLAGFSLFLSAAGPVLAEPGTTDAGRGVAPAARPAADASPPGQVPDSVELERRLQALNWHAFRAVVEAVPKLKQSVDAYGPFGWEYVRLNYQRYPWRKPIDRLDDTQKIALGELIEQARTEKATSGS